MTTTSEKQRYLRSLAEVTARDVFLTDHMAFSEFQSLEIVFADLRHIMGKHHADCCFNGYYPGRAVIMRFF